MVAKTLSPENESYMHDFLQVDIKRKYVTFWAKIDGCGNTFKIDKEELKRLLQ